MRRAGRYAARMTFSSLSRRQFLGRAAVAAAWSAGMAVPMIVPSRVLGRTRRAPRTAQQAVPPSERITLGFIGMGVMNRDHLSRFLKNDRVQVLAVCDVDTTRREHAHKTAIDAYAQRIPRGASSVAPDVAEYVDYREMLARDDIDAVVISTPDHWHANQIIDACKAGKDIYCEKPLTLTIHEAQRVMECVRKHQRVFQTGSQQRTEFDGRFRTACEYVRSGRIGRVLNANVGVGSSSKWCDLAQENMEPGLEWNLWLGPAPMRPYNEILSPRGVHTHYPQWRQYREYSGGLLTDMGAHHFDIVQWALDMDASGPIEVHPPRMTGSDRGARVVYANGVEVTHGGPSGSTIVGTSGCIAVDRDRLTSIPSKILEEPLKDDDVHLPQAPDHHANWLDCIVSRQRPICDVEVGARSITVCHLLNLAYWHGRSLKWDPQAWRFVDEDEASTWVDYQRREGFELPGS
jgi:predicted dehydrogenase